MILMPRDKKEILTHSKLVQLTMVNGLAALEMVMENNNGQMEPDMKDSGKIIELMEKANLLTLMVTFMKVIG